MVQASLRGRSSTHVPYDRFLQGCDPLMEELELREASEDEDDSGNSRRRDQRQQLEKHGAERFQLLRNALPAIVRTRRR
ncbi:unnamed protein product [Lampetra planeri]